MTTPKLDDDDFEDIAAALRIAGSSLEMAALHFSPSEDEIGEGAFKAAQVALRRQAARWRKLASRIARETA